MSCHLCAICGDNPFFNFVGVDGTEIAAKTWWAMVSVNQFYFLFSSLSETKND